MENDNTEVDKVRYPREVARRALALFSATGLAVGAPREEVIDWLESNNLRGALTPREVEFVDNAHPSEKQLINFSWQSECLIVLLWALGMVEALPRADEQCDTSVFRCLPPFSDQSVKQFISSAKLRSDGELISEADRILDLHWQARDAELNNRAPKIPIDIEVVQERHRAINWVIGCDGVEWDEVITDT